MCLNNPGARLFALLFLLFTLLPALPAQSNLEVDLLGIAAILIRDGNYKKAQETLDQVNSGDGRTDKTRYFTLSGLLALRQEDFPRAELQFRQALDTGKADSALYAYLAQALYAQKKGEETLAVLEKVPRMKSFPDLYGMKSQVLWDLGRQEEAYAVLEKAVVDFPSRLNFLQQQINYLLGMGFTQEAVAKGREYRERAQGNPGAYLTLGEAFRRGKDYSGALEVLETARLLFPQASKIKVALAQVYLEKGQPRTAASLAEEASRTFAPLILEAAELYRRTGQYYRALYLNGLVSDLPQKTKQRFSILIDAGKAEEALALIPRLDRLGLLEEDRMRYAAAYVYFLTQKYGESRNLLGKISSPDVFNQALSLRKALESSQAQGINFF